MSQDYAEAVAAARDSEPQFIAPLPISPEVLAYLDWFRKQLTPFALGLPAHLMKGPVV